jgi:capsid protein
MKDYMQFGSYYRRIIQNPYKKMGLDVSFVSPLRIQTPYDKNEGDFLTIDGELLRVYNGIAFDEYRNERYFCVSDRPPFANGYYDNAVFEWVSARHMCHVFDPQFSEQITGYPMTAPSLEKGVMRRQYEKDELRAARLGATLTGTIKTTSDFKAAFDVLKLPEQQAVAMMMFDNCKKAGVSVPVWLDDFMNLPPFTEVAAFDTKHPHSGFASHRHESIKGQGRSLRMPEHVATGSSANYNYASVQKDSQSWDNHRSCIRRDIELIDLRQAFDTFLSLASIQDKALSEIFSGKIHPIIPTFYWKEEEHAAPVKQVLSWLMLLRSGVLTHSDIMMRLGKNPERQKDEVRADLNEMKNYTIFDNGVTLSQLVQAVYSKEGDDAN